MGRVDEFELSISPLTQSPRKVWVYLPDSYDKNPRKKYPVLYMFDGHNLFFDEVATYGKSWGIKDYLDQNHLDLVVAGQDCNHTGNLRLDEYCPLPCEKISDFSGEWINAEGDITAKWFVDSLKKECEKRYRIYKDRNHVGIGGSSMGGLMALYCIAKYNDVYAKAACVSSAAFFNENGLKDLISKTSFHKNTKIYMDFGSNETRKKSELVSSMDLLLQINHDFSMKGCDTYPHLVVKGTHSEASWETIVPVFLQYLYPELYH